MKNIVVFGGGNGASYTLQDLKHHFDQVNISAVISSFDSGGSSGILRHEMGGFPPGDILRAILALSPYDHSLLKEIFYSRRFQDVGKLSKHNIGNLFLALAERYGGDIMKAVNAMEQSLGCVGKVYPNAVRTTNIKAIYSDDEEVLGEHEIDEPVGERNRNIVSLEMFPRVSARPEVLEVINNADVLIFGPGSLYTSVIASLLPTGIKEAIAASSATLCAIISDEYGLKKEFGPQTFSETASALEKYLPKSLDIIFFKRVHQCEDHALWGELLDDREKISHAKIVDFDPLKFHEKERGRFLLDELFTFE
ncbi:MAG: YvcK family protein [Parcubacteria group bacterium]|nr:YvcK family protein [Parcubacteria group bacterium]